MSALLLSAPLAQTPSATEQAAYMAGLRIDRSMLAGPLAPSPRSAMRIGGESTDVREVREVNLIGRGVVLELGRAGPDGQFIRPRLLIGRQSPELNLWMKEMGLTPERCMLPMFRGRVSRATDANATAANNGSRYGFAVLVSARCTFY